MSITSPIHTAIGQRCFLCGGELHDPAVFWMGVTAEIYLHTDCVLDLAVRVFRDVHEIRNPDYYSRRRLG